MDSGESSSPHLDGKPLTPQFVSTLREKKLNPRDLESTLQNEIRSDERYQLINDAKLRALSQGTSTYEEFR